MAVLLTIDGVERPIRRPKDKERKKEDYSGKQKAHRKKNLLLSSDNKRVVYLGPTNAGSVHDKKLAAESALVLPPEALLLKDTGFQGYEPPGGCATLQPKKKPRGGELHPIQKTINQVIAKVRVGIEHAIAGVKRCRIVAETFRNLRKSFVDEAVVVACGLHNLRVAARA